MNRKYVLALDLKEDPELIAAYEQWHTKVWPEIIASIRDAGIEQMEIFRVGNRLMMIMEVSKSFDFATKAAADANNEKVQEWESLMWNFQQPLPFSKNGEKWMLMEKIFTLP
ncbi:MAG: L-rhamnose mutarotase [Chitinophagia bacterium]|nr:L-rhamnose mutarotase [Chitinophagia bacterium]